MQTTPWYSSGFGSIDSLGRAAFLANIEERFGIEIDAMEIAEQLCTRSTRSRRRGPVA